MGYFYGSGTAQNALGPEAAAAGRVGIADAVLLVFREQLAVAAVKAGGKLEIVEFPPESPVLGAVPDLGDPKLVDAAEGAVGDLPLDIIQPGVAVVEQGHAGSHFAVGPEEGHALPDELAVSGPADHRLAVEVQVEILLGHQRPDALGGFGQLHVEIGQMDHRQDAVPAGTGVHVHKAGVEHLLLGAFVGGGDVGDVDLIDHVLGDEEGELCQLVGVAAHGHEGDAQADASLGLAAQPVEQPDVGEDLTGMAVAGAVDGGTCPNKEYHSFVILQRSSRFFHAGYGDH